jgi:hypothetical protein
MNACKYTARHGRNTRKQEEIETVGRKRSAEATRHYLVGDSGSNVMRGVGFGIDWPRGVTVSASHTVSQGSAIILSSTKGWTDGGRTVNSGHRDHRS